MFVELAAEGLEHGHKGRDWGWMLSHFAVAARVLDACHLLARIWEDSWGRSRGVNAGDAAIFTEVFPWSLYIFAVKATATLWALCKEEQLTLQRANRKIVTQFFDGISRHRAAGEAFAWQCKPTMMVNYLKVHKGPDEVLLL